MRERPHPEAKESVRRQAAELFRWSLSVAAGGVFPSRGLRGEPFDAKSYRQSVANQQLANGWRLGVEYLYTLHRYTVKLLSITSSFKMP